MGRADALVGVTEAQKAEGVLHLHFFIFLQLAHTILNLNAIDALLQKQLISIETLKRLHDYLRGA